MRLRQFAALVASVVACTDSPLPLGPTLKPENPAFLIVPPSITDLKFRVDSIQPADSMALPVYADTVLVEVRLTGTVDVHSKGSTVLQPYNGAVDGAGIKVGGIGGELCYVNVNFKYSIKGNVGPAPCYFGPQPQATWADTVLFRGEGKVTRRPGIPQHTSDCAYTNCHWYAGAQYVSVTPLPALLQLTASSERGFPGGTVSFNATVAPDSLGGNPVPLKIFWWEWTPTGGTAQTVACATPVNPCAVKVYEDGSMRVRGLANGAEQFISVGITMVTAAPSGACEAPVLKNVSHPVSSQFLAVDKSHPKGHMGRDYEVPIGTPVYAAHAGTVADRDWGPTSGHRIVISGEHRNSYYFHLNSRPTLKKGTPVSAGDLLGYSGTTGKSTGPHLHFAQTSPGLIWTVAPEKEGKFPRVRVVTPCTFP